MKELNLNETTSVSGGTNTNTSSDCLCWCRTWSTGECVAQGRVSDFMQCEKLCQNGMAGWCKCTPQDIQLVEQLIAHTAPHLEPIVPN